MIVLKNIEWELDDKMELEDAGLTDPYEIDDIAGLREYLDGDFTNYDGIIDYVSDQTGFLIRSCEIEAEIAVSFTNALYSGLFGKEESDKAIAFMEKNDLYDCMDDYDYLVIRIPLDMLYEFYENKIASKDVDHFADWYMNEYTTDDTNELLTYLEKEKGMELADIYNYGNDMFQNFKKDLAIAYDILLEERE